MIKDFWLYFFLVPVIFSLVFFAFHFLLFVNLSPLPLFAEAVEYCREVSNDTWYDHDRTDQDYCIDRFMNSWEEGDPINIIWGISFLFSIIGILFIFPLCGYLIFKLIWKKR